MSWEDFCCLNNDEAGNALGTAASNYIICESLLMLLQLVILVVLLVQLMIEMLVKPVLFL